MAHEMKVAIVGPTGAAGLELTRLLFHHPRLQPPLLLWHQPGSVAPLAELDHNGDGAVHPFSWSLVHRCGVDLLFLATPGELSRALAAEAAAHGLAVIDLSGALGLRSSRRVRDAVSGAVRAMNAIYGWCAAEGLA